MFNHRRWRERRWSARAAQPSGGLAQHRAFLVDVSFWMLPARSCWPGITVHGCGHGLQCLGSSLARTTPGKLWFCWGYIMDCVLFAALFRNCGGWRRCWKTTTERAGEAPKTTKRAEEAPKKTANGARPRAEVKHDEEAKASDASRPWLRWRWCLYKTSMVSTFWSQVWVGRIIAGVLDLKVIWNALPPRRRPGEERCWSDKLEVLQEILRC